MKRIISMVLILAMSMALCIPAFADESEIPTDSAAEPVSDMRIMYQTGMSENGIARDKNPPRQYYDLSQGSYPVDGTFEVSIYSARYFKPRERLDSTCQHVQILPTDFIGTSFCRMA